MTDMPLTVAQVIGELRDGAFIVGLAICGWKARSWFQPVKEFFIRVVDHMDIMESGMDAMRGDMRTLLHNHVAHMEQDLKTLSGRQSDDLEER